MKKICSFCKKPFVPGRNPHSVMCSAVCRGKDAMRSRWGDPKARIMATIDRRGADECWPWLGSVNALGYGSVYFEGGQGIASRVVYQIHHNVRLRRDQFVLHSCDNPICVNIKHLRVGSHKDNMRDQVKRGRRPVGAALPTTKLTEADVREIRAISSGMGYRKIAKIFNVSGNNIRAILKRRTWKYVK